MNERIKQIVEQAKASVPQGLGPDKWIEVYNENFALLIVQECVSVTENLSPGYQDYRDQIEDAFRRDCIDSMKAHFGVEEQEKVAPKPKCSVCGTTENVKYMGGYQPYLCDSVDCIPF